MPQNPGAGPGQAGAAPKGMGLAQKLLEKMGWREGQGLGRHRQGMATPLVAQKTAAHAGELAIHTQTHTSWHVCVLRCWCCRV